MTPEQWLKREILLKADSWGERKLEGEVTAENVDALYEQLVDDDLHWDAKEEVRSCGIETGLKCEWSRHYESKAVATEVSEGLWVGWTYWYGGGKHSEPQAIDWMDDAYFVDCKEEEKLVVVRTFNKKEA